jgi:large subunit ribosomal protein L10
VRGQRPPAAGTSPPARLAPRPETTRRRCHLNRDQKTEAVAALAERLGRTDTVIAADFRGLTVTELAELRRRLREAQAEMQVVKNTLARLAATAGGWEALLPLLEGPSSLVWVDGDAAVAAKTLADFAREHPDRLTLKGGVLDGASLAREDVARLAALPSRDRLLAQLAGGMAAPLSGLAGALSNLVGGLARALAQVVDQRSGEEPAT